MKPAGGRKRRQWGIAEAIERVGLYALAGIIDIDDGELASGQSSDDRDVVATVVAHHLVDELLSGRVFPGPEGVSARGRFPRRAGDDR